MNTNRRLMERKIKALLAGKIPPGVTYEDDIQGVQRKVYFDKRNKWVFKIGDGSEENQHEFDVATKAVKILKDHPEYRVPTTLLIDDVIVMEYINGTRLDEWDDFIAWEDNHQNEVESLLKCGDVHGENVIRKGKHYYIVDMAY